MRRQRKTAEYVVDAARGVNSWLDLLGKNCCAGRSYRGMDAAKESARCEEGAAEGKSADEPAQTRRAFSR
jgi:hypothetical protein